MKAINKIKQWFLICLIAQLGFNIVQADVADAVIQKIDNSDAERVEIVGDWQTSTWTGGGEFYAENYIHDKNAGKGLKEVRFTPDPLIGSYSVYLRYTSGTNRADNVPVNIRHAGGVSTVMINQKQNGGKWILLGSYDFVGDGTECVEIRNEGTNGYVIADAVAFIELSSGTPCLSDLVSYWNFDQPGEVITDQAGSNTGWVEGAAEASGIVNACLEFDGNDSVLVGDSEALRLVDTFTLSVWVKESVPSQYAKIVSRRDGDYFYFLGVDNGKPYAGVGDGDSYTTVSKLKTMPSNEWHHLAAVYRADTGSLKLYYDGDLIEMVSVAEDLPYTEGIALSIGSDEEGTDMFFNGLIDELAIFDAALPDDDIMALYMKGLAGDDYCAESLCGNGVVDPGEDCDGGSNCPSNCRYGECYATNVVSYSPGLRKDGTPILGERSNPENALGAPQGTDDINFVSLGFGGSLILEFDSRIINRTGTDFKITETSYNEPVCDTYPETAHVYASKDGDTWEDLGTGCLDSEYDLGVLDFAAFLKIVDESDSVSFANSDEGFDVDGVVAFSCGQQCQQENNDPDAKDDTATTDTDVPVDIHVLFNDTDADGDSLSIIEFTQATNGSVQENENGSVLYSPHVGFKGTDAFNYIISDGNGGTDSAIVLVTVTDSTSPPTVSFNAVPSTIKQGETTTLKWITGKAQSVSIDNNVGDVALNSDDEPGFGKIISPDIDTTYIITAVGPGGTTTDSVTVTVTPLPPTVNIFAEHGVINQDEPTQLFWDSTNADSVEIDQGIGPVACNSNYSDQDIIVSPQVTTTYTITATGPGGTVVDTVTVNVKTVPLPSASIITAADYIFQGETSWLYWHSTNADTVTIDHDIGSVGDNGCYGGEDEGYPIIISDECGEGEQVAPQVTTTYTITATGPGGTATDSVTINVNDAPPTVEIVAVPEEIEAGESTWIYWHSSHTDTVFIDQDIGMVAANGCHGGEDGGFWEGAGDDCGPGIEVSPWETITYTVTAVGPGGTSTDSVTVIVTEPTPPSVDIIAEPEMIESGEESWLYWHSANAEIVSIGQNIGVVAANGCSRDGGNVVVFPLDGEGECGEGISVSPAVTTTYTITSMGHGGIAVDSVTVFVDEVPPPTVTLTADPNIIDSGESSWLTWEATNVESVSIDQGVGNLYCDIGYGGYGGYGDCGDYTIVTPYVTTTYTITVVGPGGTATDSVTVYVDEVPPPTVFITADPEGINSGDSSWLTWEATNVESVSIDQGVGSLYCDIGYGGYGGYGDCGDYTIVTPYVTTTYTITVVGPGGTATDSVTVYVDEVPLPTVSITADPEGINSGDSSWLTWEATNVESVSIDQGIGGLYCDIGYGGYGGYGDCANYVVVSPTATTTYTITANGPGGTVTDSVTVYVDEDPLPSLVLTANPETIDLGDISWLTWEATNVESVSLDQGIGNLECEIGGYGGYGDCDNVVIVSPTITTTYTIMATGPGGTVTDSVTVFVGDGSVPTANFYADPAAIFRGGSTTLRWQTSNAETVTIDQGIGNVTLNSDEDGLVVSPETTTTYTLTVTGPGGQGTIRATVTVLEPLPPLVNLLAFPETVERYQPAILAWTSSSADTVIIEADIGSNIGEVDLNGSATGLAVSPQATTTYTIIATGPGGTVTDSVTVKVLPEIEVIDTCGSSYDNTITAGDFCELTVTARNAETVSVDQGIGDVQMTPGTGYESSGSVTVAPLERTTYTITATGNGGSSTRTIMIDVAPHLDFYTDQEIIEAGAQAHLHWTTLQADTVTLSPDPGDVEPNSDPVGMAVSPDMTTTYSLTAKGTTNSRSQSVTIYVNDISQPPAVVLFYANNPYFTPVIDPGQTARLVWETANMQVARIDNGIGDVPMFGSMEVSPERTTTYTLVVQGPQGMATEQTTVRVRGTQEAGSFGGMYEDLIPDTADDLDSERFSILTGHCYDLNGAPIAGITVSILGKPEFYETLTDGQGRYSLPVKGNNRYTAVMTKDGLLTAHRKAEVLNNRVVVLDPVTMVEPDSASTVIDFSTTPETMLFHGGQYLTDERGERRCSITIPYSGVFYEPKSISTTEYPIKAALPAPLPPNSAFAYVAEIGSNQNDFGDVDLFFEEPLIAWVDNFLGFAVGQAVPVGWYDRNEGQWIPGVNGLVVRLLDTNSDGEVDGLDIDGDGQADDLDGDGDDTDETTGLLPGEVQVGATFYRFAVDRSGPWALCWPYAATDAPAPAPAPPYYDLDACLEDECNLIEQDIAIPGTDFFLHYSEARVPAYKPVITIPVTGEIVPANAEAMIVKMTVAGKVYQETLLPEPEKTVQFQWDGRDFLGRDVTGPVFAEIAVGYVYERNYARAGGFNHAFSQAGMGDAGIIVRGKDTVWYRNRIRIERLTESDDFIADGWTLSAQHQPMKSGPATLYLGNGKLWSTDDKLITHEIMLSDGGTYGITGFDGSYPGAFGLLSGIAVDDDAGEAYWSNGSMDVIWSFGTDYETLVLRNPYFMPVPFAGDYTRRTERTLLDPAGVAIDDSGIYYVESGNNIIRKADHFGNRYGIFAGNGQEGYSGDGESALSAAFSDPGQVAVDYWGNLYIIDRGNHVIRRISADGNIETVAGNGMEGSNGDNGSALAASISPSDLAIDKQGNIYIAEPLYYKVRKIDMSGIITTVVGTGTKGEAGIDGPAALAELSGPQSVAVDSLGNLFVGDSYRLLKVDANNALREVESYSETYKIFGNIGVMTNDIEDRLFLNSKSWRDVYKISRPGFSDMKNGEYYSYIDPDGLKYSFSAMGKHLFTGAPTSQDSAFIYYSGGFPTYVNDDDGSGAISTLYSFEYDLDNLLVAVKDVNGATILTINRDADGKVLSMESSEGITTLDVDANNHLVELINPDLASASMAYTDQGLLTDFSSTFTNCDLQGTVTDNETGAPLGNVTVDLTTSQGTISLQTTPEGNYSFNDIEPGAYTLDFHQSGYYSQTVTGTIVVGANHVINDIEMLVIYLPPEIMAFRAEPAWILEGDSYTVVWEANNADHVEVGPLYNAMGNGEPVGSLTETNGADTYYIKGFGPGGETELYSIYIPHYGSDGAPPWGRITVEPSVIEVGESATLSWDSRYAGSVDFYNIDIPDAPLSGSITVSPEKTTIYGLTVDSEDPDYTSRSVFAALLTVTGPPGINARALPNSISPGESTGLIWETVRAESVSIDNGIGDVDMSGQLMISPAETTTYTITATGPEGTSTESVTVFVGESSPEIEYFQASPDSIPPGVSSKLSWSVLNADTVTIDNGIGAVASEGSINVIIEKTTTFTISATGRQGSVTASVTVTVNDLLPSVEFSADPQVIVMNQTSTLTWETTNVSEVSISYIGDVDVDGSQTVSPDRMRTYILTATGPGGTVEAVARVFVQKGNQYDYGDPTPGEQAHLEALNRARSNPEQEAARIGIDLNEGLAEGTISPDSVQPLASNAKLMQAALFHSQDMVAQQYMAHDSLDGRTVGDRIKDAGYDYSTYRENLDRVASTSPLNETESVIEAHDRLFIDTGVEGRGHRISIFDETSKEYGIGIAGGPFTGYPHAHLTTCDFSSSAWRTESFLLGVVYDDVNEDGLYSVGEGLGDVEISIFNADYETVTALAGGYGIPVLPGEYLVTARLPNGLGVSKQVNIVDQNVKLDFRRSEFVEPPIIEVGLDDNIILIGESATLDWIVTDAETVIIDNGIGLVAHEDSIIVSPTSTTTYTLSVLGAGGVVEIGITLYVIDPSATPTAEIISESASIEAGESTILSWHTTDADTVSIDGGIGNVEPDGSLIIAPISTATYTLSADGPGGGTTASVTVTVTEPLPDASISADPNTVNAGEATILTWQTADAHTVSITPDVGEVEASGSVSVVPNLTTTYTLTATGPGGTTSAAVEVTVIHPVVSISFNASADIIVSGESVELSWEVFNADSVSIDNGIGTVEVSGSISVSPETTTTYFLTAEGPAETATATVTVTVMDPSDPPAVMFYSSPEGISPGGFATLTWFVVNAETISIDNGIGFVEDNGSVSVSPTETTAYTLTANGPGGTTTERISLNVSDILMEITSPLESEVIERRDVMVTGTINNANGNETGVMVNGVLALVHGDTFTANHVPLRKGENTLTVTATDITGDSNEMSVDVTAQWPEDYIRIVALPESGTAPFKATLRVDGSFGFSSERLSYSGPGILFLEGGEGEHVTNMTVPGLYYFTAEVEKDGILYSDAVAVLVPDKNELDAKLQAVFNALKTAMAAGNVDAAASVFTTGSREKYREGFEELSESLQQIAEDMADIEMIYVHDDVAKYRIRRPMEIDGEITDITFYIYFRIDIDGLWRLEQF